MNIGLFGLSGVGKSHLTLSFCAVNHGFIGIKASEIIKSYNNKIDFFELRKSVVNNNQEMLIVGFKDYRRQYSTRNIIIELHNLIETPVGVVEIDDMVFDALDLDAVCFLEAPVGRLLNQRDSDSSRVRDSLSYDELADLQNRSRNKFISKYICGDIPFTVLEAGDLEGFMRFIRTVQENAE